jgi:hypothetical protein
MVEKSIVSIGCLNELPLQRFYDAIIGRDHLQIHCHVLLHTGIIEPLCYPFSILGLGDAPERVRKIVLASGVLDVRKELCSLSHQMSASSQEISGGSHLGWIDISLGQCATSQEYGNFMGVDLVVFTLAAMNGFHIEGMAQNERNPFSGTKIGYPVPGEHALGSHHDVFPEGSDATEESLGMGIEISV